MNTLVADDLRILWFLNTRVEIQVSTRDGQDGISVLEHCAAFGDSPPLHIHHDEDEIFRILEGEVRYQVGEVTVHARAGQTLIAPKGIPHTYRVISQDGARMLTVTRGQFEDFIRAFGRPPQNDGMPVLSGPPTPEQAEALARACLQFGIELVGPPLT